MTKKRILIANRGEIASRIAKACRELEHISIGVWTENEPHARHLEFCDEWVLLPGKNNQETYLNIENIISVAKENDVDAIHPGYGFLSENAEFSKKTQRRRNHFYRARSQSCWANG